VAALRAIDEWPSPEQPLQDKQVNWLDVFFPAWDLYLLHKRVPLITSKTHHHFNTFCKKFSWNVQLHKIPYRIGRRLGYQAPRCSTSSSVDSDKSARKKITTMTIVQWNVWTLLDRESADRQEGSTALSAMELIAVCKTRFLESGSLNDLEYSFFWSDKP